jgi:hypothetical protein
MVQPHAKLILLFAYRPIIRLILNNNYFMTIHIITLPEREADRAGVC